MEERAIYAVGNGWFAGPYPTMKDADQLGAEMDPTCVVVYGTQEQVMMISRNWKDN